MKAGRSYRINIGKEEEGNGSSFYGRHHNTKITLKPEFSTHAHAPISDSYGSSESLNAWKFPLEARIQNVKTKDGRAMIGNHVAKKALPWK